MAAPVLERRGVVLSAVRRPPVNRRGGSVQASRCAAGVGAGVDRAVLAARVLAGPLAGLSSAVGEVRTDLVDERVDGWVLAGAVVDVAAATVPGAEVDRR